MYETMFQPFFLVRSTVNRFFCSGQGECMSVYNLISFAGIFLLMVVAWIFSWEKKNINFRVIGWGLIFQLVFAALLFVFPAGAKAFLAVNDGVVSVIEASMAGVRFLFGSLALPPGTESEFGEKSPGFILAFQALPTIVFFSALMALLYYWNILPRIIRLFSRLFSRFMKISGAESLSVASNIFVGVESALTIRPHLEKMTRSELGTVITAGMATVSSNVMAIYVFSLKDIFPSIAGHLISASILSAPAAIIMAKLIMPEDDQPETLGVDVDPHYEKEENFFAAIISGSRSGVELIVGIAALLLSVLGMVALVDLILGSVGSHVNALIGLEGSWSLKGISGFLFYPFVLAMGVPLEDAMILSQIIGERIVVTEVASYHHLSAAIAEGAIQNGRSVVIATYALCGFAHFASLSIFVGGVSAIAPSRTGDLAKLGARALLAATLATLMTGAIAGVFTGTVSMDPAGIILK